MGYWRALVNAVLNIWVPYAMKIVSNYHGPDFDYMPSFFPCEIDDATQYINLGYGAQYF